MKVEFTKEELKLLSALLEALPRDTFPEMKVEFGALKKKLRNAAQYQGIGIDPNVLKQLSI